MNNYFRYIGCFNEKQCPKHYEYFYEKLNECEKKFIDIYKNKCMYNNCNQTLQYNHFFYTNNKYHLMGSTCLKNCYPELFDIITQHEKLIKLCRIKREDTYCKKCETKLFNVTTGKHNTKTAKNGLYCLKCWKEIHDGEYNRKKRENIGKRIENEIMGKSREEVLRIQYPNYYKQKDIYDKIDKINDLTTHQV